MVPFSPSLSTEEWVGFCVCSEDKASNYPAFIFYHKNDSRVSNILFFCHWGSFLTFCTFEWDLPVCPVWFKMYGTLNSAGESIIPSKSIWDYEIEEIWDSLGLQYEMIGI